jgi:Zn-finger nucleic acid-binding protein
MIQVICPHCQVGLKVDEQKVPQGIDSFKCPKCKHDIPMSFLEKKLEHRTEETNTVVFQPSKQGGGKLTVFENENTKEQIFHLREGIYIAGRKASASSASIRIETGDKLMSRHHFRIEVKRDPRRGFIHCLSDYKSKNRTQYNGNFLEEGEEVVLRNNDEIKVGHTVLRFND